MAAFPLVFSSPTLFMTHRGGSILGGVLRFSMPSTSAVQFYMADMRRQGE